MSWQIDYYLHCDLCENTTHMDGKNISEALKTARAQGWYVNGKHATCDKCLLTHRIAKNLQKSVLRELKSKQVQP